MNTNDFDATGQEFPEVCEVYRERISAVRDREHVEPGPWDRHALACAACRAFEHRLAEAGRDLAVLRGTPVADLWPVLAARMSRRPIRASWRRVAAAAGALAAGALVTWVLLGLLARKSPRESYSEPSVEHALEAIATAGTASEELARMGGTPELRLLAYLEAAKEDDR